MLVADCSKMKDGLVIRDKSAPIVVTGAGGLVGTALLALLAEEGFTQVFAPSSADVDLRDPVATKDYFLSVKPNFVYHLAARVYGILGNMENQGLSFFENVMINTNVVEASRLAKAKKIVAMGSGAVYPYPPPHKLLEESDIWSGQPHPSEESYAHAKRAMFAQLVAYKEQYGLDYVFAISGNLYGPNDKFDIEHGHVTPALVAKFHAAKAAGMKVSVWGNGSAVRDFTYVTDAALALYTTMKNGEGAINIGSGDIRPIRDIVMTLAELTDMTDRVVWDASKPNGQEFRAYRLDRLMDLGFKPKVNLRQGLDETIRWYAQNAAIARK
jgi:GDP-L-fucose synthase